MSFKRGPSEGEKRVEEREEQRESQLESERAKEEEDIQKERIKALRRKRGPGAAPGAGSLLDQLKDTLG